MTGTQLAEPSVMRMLNSMQTNANASSSATTGTTTASSSSAAAPNVTSADFLTLLVSELKNQDPTQPTDPTAYVQQLVSVNSLQQLIQINQDLGGASTTSGSGTTTSGTTTQV